MRTPRVVPFSATQQESPARGEEAILVRMSIGDHRLKQGVPTLRWIVSGVHRVVASAVAFSLGRANKLPQESLAFCLLWACAWAYFTAVQHGAAAVKREVYL